MCKERKGLWVLCMVWWVLKNGVVYAQIYMCDFVPFGFGINTQNLRI
jgi:hypothetical protein